jgi:fumarate hydratase class II
MTEFRVEKDSLGEVRVPAQAYWGAQTQRAVENFPILHQPLPARFVRGLGLVKLACARVNRSLGRLDPKLGEAIERAALAQQQTVSAQHVVAARADVWP